MLICVDRIKERSTKIPLKGGQRGVSNHSYCMYVKHPSKSPLIRGDFVLPEFRVYHIEPHRTKKSIRHEKG